MQYSRLFIIVPQLSICRNIKTLQNKLSRTYSDVYMVTANHMKKDSDMPGKKIKNAGIYIDNCIIRNYNTPFGNTEQ